MASSLKFIVVLALVAAVTVVHADSEDSQGNASVQPSGTTSNDLILGKREKGDKLVVTNPVKKGRKLLQVVTVKKIFEVGNMEITMVKAMDRASKNGASVELIAGGVGHDSVTLRFKSKKSKGIDFKVQVYAKAGGGSGGGSEEPEEEEEDLRKSMII